MKITSIKDGDYYLIQIEGDLDASSCINLDKAISEAASREEKKLLIDCARLDYISSAGLGVFMSYLQDFQNKKIGMALYDLNPKVKKVFEILGLHELINIVSNKEEAKSLIDESQH